jgi:hypothetical protein
LKFGHLVEGTYNSRASGNLSGLKYLQVDGLSDKTSKKTLANHTAFNAAHKRRCGRVLDGSANVDNARDTSR